MPRPKMKKTDVVSEEFKNAIASMDTEELKERVVTLSRQEGEIIKARKDDTELTDASDRVKELKGPYAEALKKVKSERQYVHVVLEERGQ